MPSAPHVSTSAITCIHDTTPASSDPTLYSSLICTTVTAVHVTAVHVTAVHVTAVHVTAVHVTAVHVTAVHFCSEIIPRCNNCGLILPNALLYMFRVTITSIIRSTCAVYGHR